MIGELSKFVKSEGFKRYFKNTSWLFWGKIIQMGMTFMVSVYVARYLGDSAFGLLNYAERLGTFFVMFAALGMQSILIRNLVKDKKDRGKIIGTAIIMRVIASSLGIIGYFIALPFIPHDYQTNVLVILVIMGTLFQSFDVFDYFYQSEVKSQFTVQVRIASVLCMAAFQLALIYFQAPLIWFGVAILLRTTLMGIGLAAIYFTQFGTFKELSVDPKYALSLLKDSWPLIFSDLVVILYMTVDTFMLKWMLGNSAVGQYSVALKLSSVWYFIAPILTGSLFPAIINAQKKDPILYKNRLQNYYNLMVWVALAITIPMVLFGPWLLDMLYGNEYNQAGPVLVIHIWTLAFVFLGTASHRHMVAENEQKMDLYRTLIGAIFNVFANYFFITKWGIIGAAYATLASQAVASYLAYLFFPKFWYVFRMQTRAIFLVDIFKKIAKKS
ncbi:MAG: flippase [Bacteroidota bacterium]